MAELRLSLAHGLAPSSAATTASGRVIELGPVRVPSSSSSLTRKEFGATVGLRRLAVLRGFPPSGWCTPRESRRSGLPLLKIRSAKQTFSSFNDMIANSEIPVLVDFYATWCGPCQVMAPILKEVGAAMKDKIRVVKVDTEKYQQVASRYGISALPTLVLFAEGKPINYVEGVQDKESLISNINRTLETLKSNV